MSDLITQLAEFDRRRGKEPINPSVIQGFGENDPPAPSFPAFTPPTSTDDIDDPEPEPDVYVQRTPPAEVPRTEPPPRTAELPQLELCILDRTAGFRGQTVELNREEWGAVVLVVLAALRRTVDALRDEVQGSPGTGGHVETFVPPAPPVKRGRGRPRKVQA